MDLLKLVTTKIYGYISLLLTTGYPPKSDQQQYKTNLNQMIA